MLQELESEAAVQKVLSSSSGLERPAEFCQVKKIIPSLFDRIPPFQRYRLGALLADFSRVATETDTPNEIYGAVNALLLQVLEFDRIAIRFVDPGSSTLTDTFVSGYPIGAWGANSTRPISGTITEAVFESGQPILITNCNDDAVLRRYPNLKISSSALPSLICVPMMNGETVVGVVLIRSSRVRAYSGRDLNILRQMTAHFTPALISSREWAVTQKEVHDRTVLAEIGRLASSTTDIGSVWEQIVGSALKLIHFDRMVLAIVEEDGETITDRFVYGVRLENWDENPQRKKLKVPADWVMRSMGTQVVEKKENDAAHLDLLGYVMSERTGLKTAMYAPLMGSDQVIGTVSLRSLKENAFAEKDRLLFEQIVEQISGSVASAELYRRSQRLTREMESRVRLELENKKLEQLNQTKARFISMVSHELRTPLTSVIAFTDIIGQNRDGSLNERDLAHLSIVKRNGSRLKLLIEDLLVMSEMDSGDISTANLEFSLKESIEQLADSIDPILAAKNQTLVTSFSNPGIILVSDRIRLEQILANLLSNASKYSDSYSEIKIDVIEQNGRVSISVIDYGDGIGEDEIPSLFNEFSRLDNEATKAAQGSGLGLAISRQLARALGGTLEVSSKKGEGSIFTVVIPDHLSKAV